MDTGSDCDLIDKKVIEELNMDTTEQTIEMHVVENVTTKRRQIASFPIESVRGDFSSEMDVIVGEIHPAPGSSPPGCAHGIILILRTSSLTVSTPNWA